MNLSELFAALEEGKKIKYNNDVLHIEKVFTNSTEVLSHLHFNGYVEKYWSVLREPRVVYINQYKNIDYVYDSYEAASKGADLSCVIRIAVKYVEVLE